MANPALTDRILRQGKALVRAIEALGTIDPSGPIERAAARRLLCPYKRRLRGVVEVAPAWMVEEILSASEHVGDERCCSLGRTERGTQPVTLAKEAYL